MVLRPEAHRIRTRLVHPIAEVKKTVLQRLDQRLRKTRLLNVAPRHPQQTHQVEVAAIGPLVYRSDAVQDHLLIEIVPHAKFHRRDLGKDVALRAASRCIEQCLPPPLRVRAVALRGILVVADDVNIHSSLNAQVVDIIVLGVGEKKDFVIVLRELKRGPQHHLLPLFTLRVVFAVDAPALAHQPQRKIVGYPLPIRPAYRHLRMAAVYVPVQVSLVEDLLQCLPPARRPHRRRQQHTEAVE